MTALVSGAPGIIISHLQIKDGCHFAISSTDTQRIDSKEKQDMARLC